VNAKQIVEDTAAESANAQQIDEDTAMKNVSIEMEGGYIAHGLRQPTQQHARRAGIAASMARWRAMPGRVR